MEIYIENIEIHHAVVSTHSQLGYVQADIAVEYKAVIDSTNIIEGTYKPTSNIDDMSINDIKKMIENSIMKELEKEGYKND